MCLSQSNRFLCVYGIFLALEKSLGQKNRCVYGYTTDPTFLADPKVSDRKILTEYENILDESRLVFAQNVLQKKRMQKLAPSTIR